MLRFVYTVIRKVHAFVAGSFTSYRLCQSVIVYVFASDEVSATLHTMLTACLKMHLWPPVNISVGALRRE